ncbi:hypothetical protein DRQ33_04575 [bacterium]|nr:MAG: hypothetical protein DRQ33_04575 [bacterium]
MNKNDTYNRTESDLSDRIEKSSLWWRKIRTTMGNNFGLIILLIINLGPIFLVVRQAFAPESESATWPLTLLPSKLSLQNLFNLWKTQSLLEHLLLSLWVALGTTIISIFIGFPAGWSLARWKKIEGFGTRFAIVSRILPPIAIAIPLTALLIPLRIYNHPFGPGLILAHLTIGLPFAILLSYSAFLEIPNELEEAAYIDGCSTFGAFIRIALPSVKGTIATAFILIFLLSWDEFTYALLIQLTHRTMPPLIYYYTEFGQLASASVLAVIMLIPAILIIVFLQRILNRGVLRGGIK